MYNIANSIKHTPSIFIKIIYISDGTIQWWKQRILCLSFHWYRKYKNLNHEGIFFYTNIFVFFTSIYFCLEYVYLFKVNTETIIEALHEVPSNSTKRRVEDLFGDIDDIDFDDDREFHKLQLLFTIYACILIGALL